MHRRHFLKSVTAAAAYGVQSVWAANSKSAGLELLQPKDPGYAEARQVFNSTILARPAFIARCSTESDVIEAIQFAAKEQLPVSIKSGGHSFEGFCLSQDGLTVEISRMKAMQLDKKSGVLTAGPGCQLAELNLWLMDRNRILPSGSCATVGLSGLTLGGGYGLFARKFGLTCDHLQHVRMVDANGEVHDSRDERELLWACRGGGNGHFGVVTEFSLQTRYEPTALAAFKFRVFKLDETRATTLLKTWFEASEVLPREAFSAFVINGRFLSILVTTFGSTEHKGLKSFLKILRGVTDKATNAKPLPLRQALPRYYGEKGPVAFKNASAGFYKGFGDLKPALPGILQETFSTPGIVFQVNTLGGAIAEGPDSAYPHRDYPFLGEWQAYWDQESRRESCVAAAGRIREILAENGVTRHYANYPSKEFKHWQTSYYGAENYRRLQLLKKQIDPKNRFRHPQSVKA